MFFPVGDDQVKDGYKPFFAYAFLVVNILVFLFQLTLPAEPCNAFITTFGVVPKTLLEGHDLFSLITSMFLHAGFIHIIGNMLFLWVFADNIEAVIGHISFIIFYLLGGIVASGVHIMTNMTSEIPAIGASGAIAAVLGAYIVMFPKSRIKVRFLIFRPFVMTALAFLGLWFVQNLFSGIGALTAEAAQSGGTAWWAHIGGFVFGIIGGFLVRNYYVISRNINRV